MTKEVAIQKAYGEHWETVKDYVDINGWCSVRKKIMFDEISVNIEMQKDGYYWRPKILQGIENNNGWTKIESINDLPRIKDELIIFKYGNAYTTTWISDDIQATPNYFMRYSHWRIKYKILEPIF